MGECLLCQDKQEWFSIDEINSILDKFIPDESDCNLFKNLKHQHEVILLIKEEFKGDA